MFTQGYTFDDVLLIPKHSSIGSREEVDLSVSLPKGIELKIPFVSANMATVTDVKMAETIAELGGLAILHRFDDYGELFTNYDQARAASHGFPGAIGASVGIKPKDLDLIHELNRIGCKIICVDVAHGDHTKVAEFVSAVHTTFPGILLIAGNVVTAKGASLLWNAGADIIKIGVGPGCFGAGTRILMSNGLYKNIEDIKPGERIINMDGKPKSVLKAFCTGIRKVSKIRNSISYKATYVTPDHQYFIGDLSSISKTTLESIGYSKALKTQSKTTPKQSKLKWQEIGNINKVALLMPNNIEFEFPNSFKKEIVIRDGWNGHSSIKVSVDFVIEPTIEVGYIFGTFLGDGHAMIVNNGRTNTGAIHWYFGVDELHIAHRLAECIKTLTGRALKIKAKENIIVCSLYHKPFAEFLSGFGKRTEKYLPPEYIVNNIGYLQGIHDGLMDSDGSIESGGRKNFKNTSIHLIELFNIVTYLLTKVFPNNQQDKVTSGNLKGANIENFNTPYVSRINNTAEKRVIDNYQISKLLEYTNINDEVSVFDLTIDCETHSFIADNAIVHNSLCTTRIETGNGYPQLSALDIVCNDGNYSMRDDQWPMFIADGGIKSAGDCVKALAFAELVMIGNLFAGTDEAPGEIIQFQGKKFKRYAGSSTHKQKHVEGVVALVPYKSSVRDVVLRLVEGIKSGCSYQGSKNLADLKADPHFVVISNAGLTESHPHNVML
ncbi:IMP dehydrogenase [Candidatus Pacearchaeota archaeon]|jgi:IMP dehydrogenase/GMP reductase|nr:IMP dehydrogenase [Candidatus Pacearchaeota archaeon]